MGRRGVLAVLVLALTWIGLALALGGCGGGGGGSVGPGNAGTILYIVYYHLRGTEVRMVAPDGSKDELVLGLTNPSDARISPDGRYLVYAIFSGTGETFVSEMWIRRLEGGGEQRVFVSSTLRAEYCSVSHDSSKIVFTAHEIHWTQPNGPREIYVVNVDGTGLRKLTSGSGGMGFLWPSPSPDGTKIVCEYNWAIVVMSSDGSGATTLGSGREPGFSPDGTRIVFVNSGLVSVSDVDGSNFRQLPGVSGDSSARSPCFSPDGTRIAFSSSSASDPVSQIYVLDIAGSNLRKLTSVLGDVEGAETCSWGGA